MDWTRQFQQSFPAIPLCILLTEQQVQKSPADPPHLKTQVFVFCFFFFKLTVWSNYAIQRSHQKLQSTFFNRNSALAKRLAIQTWGKQ